jgi:hypothetical protein
LGKRVGVSELKHMRVHPVAGYAHEISIIGDGRDAIATAAACMAIAGNGVSRSAPVIYAPVIDGDNRFVTGRRLDEAGHSRIRARRRATVKSKAKK